MPKTWKATVTFGKWITDEMITIRCAACRAKWPTRVIIAHSGPEALALLGVT